MKKIALFSLGFVALFLLAFNLHLRANPIGWEDSLILLNIELLSTPEDTGGVQRCYLTGTLDCPLKEVKVKYVI